MKSKSTFFIILLMLFGTLTFSQTASLAPPITASPGEDIVVPINVNDFTNIGAITLYIRFDQNLLQFSGVSEGPSGLAANATDSILTLAWYGPPYLNIVSGTLVKLHFAYNGPGTSELVFLTSGATACEVVQMPGLVPLPVAYTNGLVLPKLDNSATATIIGQSGVASGSTVIVPVRYSGFPGNVGAVTQVIKYDQTQLTFNGGIANGNLSGSYINAVNGYINITWTNTDGKNINYPESSYILNFTYIGNTATELMFSPGCIITDNGVVNIPVSYFNGTISPSPTNYNAELGDISGVLQGNDYIVPLDLSGFIEGPGGVAAITLNIPFDSPRLSFLGVLDKMFPGNTTVNQTGSTISIAYTNNTVPTPSVNGTFLKLKFKYNGIGAAHVNFGPGCLFSNIGGGALAVNQKNSLITPAIIAGHNGWIGTVSALTGQTVSIPVSFTEMPTDSVGAITLHIGFDASKLTFIEGTDFPEGTYVSLNSNEIIIAWSSSTPLATINSVFGNLKFLYSGNGALAEVFFKDGCEVAAVQGPGAIININWFNGGVNLNQTHKVSGILSYNSDPNTQIALSGYTVYLKSFLDNTVITSAVTDQNGYYELWAVNGMYTLDAVQNPASIWYADLPDVAALFNYTLGIPIPYSNPLRIHAGDVAAPLNGSPNLTDVVTLFHRAFFGVKPAAYIANDWIFERPVVYINSFDITDKDFMGLCTGNVLGSNPNP